MVEKEVKEEIIEKDKTKSKTSKILVIVVGIILVIVCFICGWLVGNKTNIKNGDVKEENNKKENEIVVDDEEEVVAIDKDEAPNKTVVIKEYKVSEISKTKPDYSDVEYDNPQYYKDGYVGYYNYDDYISFNNNKSGLVQVDSPKHKFVSLYKCKNPEYGKCGAAEPLMINKDYNLEEELSLSVIGMVYLEDRYVFVYDSEYYLKDIFSNYFSKESPLIIYDVKNNKELGKYLGVVYSYGDTADNLIAVDLNGKYGVISIDDGKVSNKVEFKYDYIGKLFDSKDYMLVKDGQYYYYNSTDTKKVGPFNNQISNYSSHFIVTNEGKYSDETEKNYRLYTTKGKKIVVESGYKYIEVRDNYAIVVDKDDNLNIYNSEGKAILKDSIKLIDKGEYHIRCCESLLNYKVEIKSDVMSLSVLNNNVPNKNYDNIYDNYVINLKTGSVEKK